MMLALLRLTRPYYSLPLSCGLVVIVAYVVGGDISAIGSQLSAAVISLFLVISGGYVFNDVCDKPVDAVNRPERPLPMGTVIPKTALLFSAALMFLGIMLSGVCGRRYFAVLVLVALGLVLYDLYSKKMGFFKNIFAAALTTSLYPLSFALAEPVITPRLNALYIFPVWLFLTTVGYEMLKDISDVKGDSIRSNHRGYCSHPAFLLTAKIVTIFAALLSILPYLLGYCRGIYLGFSIVTIGLAAWSLGLVPEKAIRPVYAGVFLITVGSLTDLLVFGP